MTPEQAKEIVEALQNKGVRLPCPRCANQQFKLLEGFFNQPVSGDMTGGTQFSGPGCIEEVARIT